MCPECGAQMNRASADTTDWWYCPECMDVAYDEEGNCIGPLE